MIGEDDGLVVNEKTGPKVSKSPSTRSQTDPGQTLFYGFVQLPRFKLYTGVHFKVRMGKVSTAVRKRHGELTGFQKS
jgi:hypothetical protein